MKDFFINPKLNLIFSVISITLIVGIAFNGLTGFFWQDDFSFYVTLKQQGLYDFAKEMYLRWDGRFFTITGFVQSFLIKYISASLINVFWASVFLLSSFFTLKVLNCRKHMVIALGLVSATLIVLFNRHAYQTIYWAVGGAYVFNLLIGVFWLWLYSKKEKTMLIYILSIFLGATTQNLVVCAITIVLFDLINKKMELGTWDKKRMLLLLLFIPGLLFISLSPGSIHRSGAYSELEYSFVTIISDALELYMRGFGISIFALPLIVITALFLSGNSEVEPLQDRFMAASKYFLAAISSVSVFAILPPELSLALRIYIYFQFFLFLSLTTAFIGAIQYIKQRSFLFTKYYGYVTVFGVGILFVLASAIIWKNLSYGIHLKQKVLEREKLISNSKENANVIIPKLGIKYGIFYFMHNFHDFNKSADFFSNKAAAEYYDVESISVGSEKQSRKPLLD